jgi:hypothetical protein
MTTFVSCLNCDKNWKCWGSDRSLLDQLACLQQIGQNCKVVVFSSTFSYSHS